MKTKYLTVGFDMEELAHSISQELSYKQIREFINYICDASQDYELDAGIYSDRYQVMQECLMEGESFNHGNTIENFPPLKKEE